MIRFFSIFLFLAVSLYAFSDNVILKRANDLTKSGTKADNFRAYNDYKSLYLRAIMSDNKNLKIDALKGIVKTGNSLHIDVSDYASELKKTNPNISKSKRRKKSLNIHRSFKLNSTNWNGNKLILTFDKELKTNQINYFKNYDSKTSKHRYVFDIHASMFNKSKYIRKKGLDKIKLVQYKIDTIRLVFENKTKVNIRFKVDVNKLIITVMTKQQIVKKVNKTKVYKKVLYTKRLDRDKVVVIDAGHGGKDPGAIGYKKYREKVVVFKIAKELKKILRSRGYKVYMTRDRDNFVKLSNRTKFANRKKADIFVSIHANAVNKNIAADVEGLECYFLSPSRSKRAEKVAASENSADLSDMNKYGKNTFLNFLNHHKILASNKLAIDLQRGILGHLNKKYNVKDGGVREGPFWVLVGAQMPAVLVEVGFISHPDEAKKLISLKYQRSMALGMANGIERYFANNCK